MTDRRLTNAEFDSRMNRILTDLESLTAHLKQGGSNSAPKRPQGKYVTRSDSVPGKKR